MSAGRCAAIACAAAFVVPAVSGDDGDPGAPERWSTVVATGAAYRRPSPGLSERVAATLDEGLPVAKERLRSHASCRALFTRLGSDGAAKVDEASYHPATALLVALKRNLNRKRCEYGLLT